MPAPSKRNSSSRPQPPPRNSAPQSTTPELIDPRWILKALAIVLIVALLCAWGTLCLLWYQGQWQLVLHPSRTVATTPASDRPQIHRSPIRRRCHRLAATQRLAHSRVRKHSHTLRPHRALPSLRRWLHAPTRSHAHSHSTTPASTSCSSTTAATAVASASHPNQVTMQQDADAALNWLISTQHIPPRDIILYGQGIGASLAVNSPRSTATSPPSSSTHPTATSPLESRRTHTPRSFPRAFSSTNPSLSPNPSAPSPHPSSSSPAPTHNTRPPHSPTPPIPKPPSSSPHPTTPHSSPPSNASSISMSTLTDL